MPVRVSFTTFGAVSPAPIFALLLTELTVGSWSGNRIETLRSFFVLARRPNRPWLCSRPRATRPHRVITQSTEGTLPVHGRGLTPHVLRFACVLSTVENEIL